MSPTTSPSGGLAFDTFFGKSSDALVFEQSSADPAAPETWQVRASAKTAKAAKAGAAIWAAPTIFLTGLAMPGTPGERRRVGFGRESRLRAACLRKKLWILGNNMGFFLRLPLQMPSVCKQEEASMTEEEPRPAASQTDKLRAWLKSDVTITLPGWALALGAALALVLIVVALD